MKTKMLVSGRKGKEKKKCESGEKSGLKRCRNSNIIEFTLNRKGDYREHIRIGKEREDSG